MIALHEAHDPQRHGAKAAWLARLVGLGSSVAEGWVIGSDELTGGVSPELSDQLRALPQGLWAVRSSSVAEDLAEASFAGQYHSELAVPTTELPQAVARVLASAGRVVDYRPGAGHGEQAMAVIVQRHVEADRAGVVFTLDPTTGAETTVVIEQASGTAAELLDGQRTPQRQRFDWRTTPPEQLPPEAAEALRLQRAVGHPLDVEFAVQGERLWIIQARPITALAPQVDAEWTTGNFRDGGVSARACTPLMWSLYGLVWENSLRDFLLGCGMVEPEDWVSAGRMLYGRPYWQRSQVKQGMSRIAGYDEREFDNEFGLAPGPAPVITPVTPSTVATTVGILARHAARRRHWRSQRDERVRRFDQQWRLRMAELDARQPVPEDDEWALTSWRELVEQWHLPVQTSYFELIFLNTVSLAVAKQALLRLLTLTDWFELVGGLDEVSHLAPAHALWQASRELRARPEMGEDEQLELVRPVLDEWGYHSDRELDLSHPAWREDPTPVLRQLRALAALDESHSPAAEQARSLARLRSAQQAVVVKLGPVRGRLLLAALTGTRRDMWWREEFRDISTRWYHLTRRSALAVADVLVRRGVLEQVDDIWFVTSDDLAAHLDGTLSAPALRERVAAGRAYFESFVNFEPPMELGVPPQPAPHLQGDTLVSGQGASQAVAIGRARVVDSPEQLSEVQAGDILVARFTDTGWTAHFATLGGLVTEHGGTLCHAAVVAREYGIACVVAAPEATSRIPEGAIIRVDGATGRVDQIG